MKLYFIRHGKTEWNLEGRFQGYSGDSPLLPQAIEELKQLGKHLADIPFDAIYSSDSQRAHATAKQIVRDNHHCQHIETSPQLREWNFGKLEGTKVSLFRSIYPKQAYALKHNLATFHHELFGAESVYQVCNRMTRFVKQLKEQEAEHVLIVSHGAILTASIHKLLGYSSADLRKRGGLDNASISILETDDFETFQAIRWNDTSYKQIS